MSTYCITDNVSVTSTVDSDYIKEYNNNGVIKVNKQKLPKHLTNSMNPLTHLTCVNAVSGHYYVDSKTGKSILNGSKPMKQLFAVINSTAPDGIIEPRKLFYDSPEQYERHRHIKLDKIVKENWRKKMVSLGYSQYGIGTSNDFTENTPVTTTSSNTINSHILAHM
jgi:hypothetical protein